MDNLPNIMTTLSIVSPKQLIKIMKTLPQVDCPVYHHFGPGIYIRELNAPAGSILVGYKQKTEHLNVFLQGKVCILTPDKSFSIMTAPMIFTSPPGRKIGYIMEDMVWLNIYATDETNIEKLENIYLDKSEAWSEDDLKALNKLHDRSEDVEDFYKMLEETGFTAEQIKRESEYEGDLIPFPPGTYAVAVFPSAIEGKGLFATANFSPGDIIAPARIGSFRTPAGRYINHAKNPNAVFVKTDYGIGVMAIKPIRGNQGGILGDEITIDYRESVKIRKQEY